MMTLLNVAFSGLRQAKALLRWNAMFRAGFAYILPEYVEESKIPWMIGMRQKFADKLKSCCAEQLTESEYNKLVARMDEIVKDYPPNTIVRARFH